jgi:two-component system, OmpR family, response regulator
MNMLNKELKKILYAEDEDDIRAIAQIALEDIGGYTVRYCTNGQKIIEAAKEFIPDLLLLDVMMPETDGPTALLELRKNPDFINIPAIFMTAKIQSDELREYQSIGAIEVITKPFNPITLAETIQNAWLKYRG